MAAKKSIKKPGNFPCKIKSCGKSFDSAYDLSKHMAQAHPVKEDEGADVAAKLPPVIIRTTRPVEATIAGRVFKGDKLEVPYIQADDVRRVLIDAYGPEILKG